MPVARPQTVSSTRIAGLVLSAMLVTHAAFAAEVDGDSVVAVPEEPQLNAVDVTEPDADARVAAPTGGATVQGVAAAAANADLAAKPDAEALRSRVPAADSDSMDGELGESLPETGQQARAVDVIERAPEPAPQQALTGAPAPGGADIATSEDPSQESPPESASDAVAPTAAASIVETDALEEAVLPTSPPEPALPEPPVWLISADHSLLPRPEGILPAVEFWRRVYSEINTAQGFLHDSRHLDIIYMTLDVPAGAGWRKRNRAVDVYKKKLLKQLARLEKLPAEALHLNELSAEDADIARLFLGREHLLAGAAKRLRFQLGQSDRFRLGLERSGEWIDFIRNEFEVAGLPVELAALPHVESSFNNRARSHIGASGIWQFTRSTGRRYMRVDHVVDERNDPYVATRAAVQLLSHNYKATGTWPMAITAYNHGASGMRRAARKLGTKDIDVVIARYKSKTFGFASRNFYAAFLAASDVERNSELFFGNLQRNPPRSFVEVPMPAYYSARDLSRAADVSLSSLQTLNPGLLKGVWRGEKRLPKGYSLRFPATVDETQLLTALNEIQAAREQLPDEFHRVLSGESLSVIAAQYRIGVDQLMALNNLSSPHLIRAGMILRLPLASGGAASIEEALAAAAEPATAGGAESVNVNEVVAPELAAVESSAIFTPLLTQAQIVRVALELVPWDPAGAAVGPVLAAAPWGGADPEPDWRDEPDGLAALFGSDTELGPVQVPLIGLPALAADPSNYSVREDQRIEIQVDETIGHYAEWSGRSARELRALNSLRRTQLLVVGRWLLMDFSKNDIETFETRRRRYHQERQETYFAQTHITGTTEHIVRRGDSVWELAQVRYKVPLWLLRQYNPDQDLAKLALGDRLLIPKVVRADT